MQKSIAVEISIHINQHYSNILHFKTQDNVNMIVEIILI